MKINTLINRAKRPLTPSRTRRGGVLAGCLIALGIVVVIAIIGAVVVWMNWKTWAADGTVALTRTAINDSSLPESEKPEMIAVVQTFTDRFKSGDITFEEFGTTLGKVMESNLFPIGSAYAFDNGYVQPSGLTDEEKADGSTQLMRIAMGLYDGTIGRGAYEDVFDVVKDENQTAQANGQTILIFKDSATDDEVKQVIEAARDLADTNGISATPTLIDLSDALAAEIAKSLGETPAAPADPSDETPSEE